MLLSGGEGGGREDVEATMAAISRLQMDAVSTNSESMKILLAAQARQEKVLAKLTADAPTVALRKQALEVAQENYKASVKASMDFSE